MNVRNYLLNELHFTEFQIEQVKYFVVSVSSELSKLILFGIFFFYMGLFREYLFSVTVLCLIRMFSGGIHFKHYTSCFIMSFAVMYTGIYLLPMVPTTKLTQIVFLVPCLLCHYFLAPVVSCYRPVPDGVRIKKAQITSSMLIGIYIVLLYVLPQSTCTTAGFWIIIVQSLQLAAAKVQKRRKKNETLYEQMDGYRV